MSPVPPRITCVTLGVGDLARATEFYEALGWVRSPASADEVSFFRTAGPMLALFGRDDLAADATVPSTPHAGMFTGVTLAINVNTDDEVDDALAGAAAAGATIVKAAAHTEYGGYSGYFADPEGNLWEVVRAFTVDDDGRIVIP